MKLTDTIRACDDVVGREVGGEMVLLNLASGLYFGLDPVGGRVWQLLSDEPRSVAALRDAIDEEYDAPKDRIEKDIIDLASDLLAKELVEIAAG